MTLAAAQPPELQQPELVDTTDSLADFLGIHRESLVASVNAAYPPIITKAEVPSELVRTPLGRQAEAITALAQTLKSSSWSFLVGEMGTGKSFTGIAAAYKAGFRRVLILVPPHLTKKTVREIETTLPNVRTRILKSISDVEALRDIPDDKPMFVVLSREKAKLGHGWRAAFTFKRRSVYYPDLNRWMHYPYPACPKCGSILETDEGIIKVEDIEKKKHACPGCNEQLWQADNEGVRRYALAHYIVKKLRGFFDLYILDEAHESKARGSAQGIATAALAQAIPKSLAMTGTLLGGYASTIFYLLQRFSPEFRRAYSFNDERRFVETYGVLERVWYEGANDSKIGSHSKRTSGRAQTKEKPGVSPALLKYVLPNTVFMRLSDVSQDLPPYSETVELIPMEDNQKAVHLEFKDELTDAVQQDLAAGGKKLLGAFITSLMHHPDSPWREEAVYKAEEDGTVNLVAAAEALTDDIIYPKEQRLIDLVKAEKVKGRRVLVFVQGTDKRDVTERYQTLLEQEGLRAAVLKSHTTSAENREAWVKARVGEGLDALICHPRVVQTGLDLLEFPAIVYMQVEVSVFTLRQASRRSWRIGQKQPVKVIHLGYQETAQVTMLGLIAKKVQSSLALEGELVTGGLVDMAGGDSMLELARKLMSGDEGAVTDFSSVVDTADDFISAIETDDFSLWDMVGAGFGQPIEPPASPIITVRFTDAPTKLGRSRKVIPEGTGMLFPELMSMT